MLLFMAHSLEWTGFQMRKRHSRFCGINDNPDSFILNRAQAYSMGFVWAVQNWIKTFLLEKVLLTITLTLAVKGSPWHLVV